MPAPDTRTAPSPDPARPAKGRQPDSVLLYTLPLANGRTVSVYGNPATWRQSAAGMLMDARRILQRAEVDHSAHCKAVAAVAQIAQLPQE